MRRLMLVVFGLTMGVTVSQGDRNEYWEMRVHEGGSIQAFVVTEIDSISFHSIELPGACCIEGTCSMATETGCIQAGGEFYPDSDCSPNPCPPFEAVCCGNDGYCVIMIEEYCELVEGIWHPEWDSCDPNPCVITGDVWVQIPAGTFIMGSPLSEPDRGDDEVLHTVTLTSPFEMFATEITNQQFADLAQWAFDLGYCTATSSRVNDALDGSTQDLLDMSDYNDCEISFSNGTFAVNTGKEDHPVLEVTWYGAVAYCDWLSLQAGLTRAYDHSTWECNGHDPYNAVGYRLPTEAEWEYACRAGTQTPFNTGDCLDAGTDANYNGNYPYSDCPSGPDVGWAVPVGSYPPNSFDIYDMHGNLREWCNDFYGAYSGDETNPVGPGTGDQRLVRGGSWEEPAEGCRSARRYYTYPQFRFNYGFRPVKSIN